MNKKETLLIVLLCFITRLPQLLSSNLLLDGDECIVGLMAKHLYEGKEIPLFFYGQSYGFSFLELLPIDLHYLFFGISDISVKLAMLVMWSIGILLFYKTLIQLNFKNQRLPLFITLFLIFAPAWAVWSMKARGGYLTSFVLTFLITSLIFNENINKKKWIWLLIGFLSVIIFQSQPLWLPGLLPIIILKLYDSHEKKAFLSILTGVFLCVLLFYFLKKGMPIFWEPHVFALPNLWHSLYEIPYRVFLNMAGSFYYEIPDNHNFVISLIAWCLTIMVLALPFILLILTIIKKHYNPLLLAFLSSTLLTISYALFLLDFDPRYLLPLMGYFLLMFSILADKIKNQIAFKIFIAFFVCIGSISLYSFKYAKYESFKKENLSELIRVLNSKDIHYVFCTNPLLQWEIDYYSQEKIIARYTLAKDRYPPYITTINNAFSSGKVKIAVTGRSERVSPYWKEKILVDDVFFINENPNSLLLSNYGFEMNDPKP
jgi:hypothetical protein